MTDLQSKFIAAAASVAVTAAILVSLGMLAQASGVPSWIDAVESNAAATAALHPDVPMRTAADAIPQAPARF